MLVVDKRSGRRRSPVRQDLSGSTTIGGELGSKPTHTGHDPPPGEPRSQVAGRCPAQGRTSHTRRSNTEFPATCIGSLCVIVMASCCASTPVDPRNGATDLSFTVHGVNTAEVRGLDICQHGKNDRVRAQRAVCDDTVNVVLSSLSVPPSHGDLRPVSPP